LPHSSELDTIIDEIGVEGYDAIYQDMYDIDCFGCLMYRANRIMANRLNRAFRKTGNNITLEQFRVFLYLWEGNGVLQSELVNKTGKDKASVARTLDVMEKQNLIVRTSTDSDQRQRRIILTNKGKELKDILVPVAIRSNLDYISMIGKEKMDAVRSVLRELLTHLTE
jgi:DNA-binding MarR family transcriptional regulator